MSIAFYDAVQQVVSAHVKEVRDLQEKIAGNGRFSVGTSSMSMESLENGLKRLLQDTHPDSSGVVLRKYEECCLKPLPTPETMPSRRHQLTTPLGSNARTPRSKSPCTPRNEDLVGFSLAKPTPRSPTCEENAANSLGVVKMSTPQQWIKSEESADSPLIEDSLHRGSAIIGSVLESAASGSMFLSHTSTYTSELHKSSSIDTFTISDDIVSRWETLTLQVLVNRNNAHYKVHPGWLETMKETGFSQTATSNQFVKSIASQNMAKEILARESQRLLNQDVHPSRERISDRFTGSSFGMPRRTSKVPKKRSFVLHPRSRIRQAWQCLCYVFFLYEVIALTMSPFRLLDGPRGRILEYCSVCFWACDIFVNFISGFYVRGHAETRFVVVAKRYAKTWFMFDVIVVTCQFTGLLVESLTERLNATIVLRLIRVARSVRLGSLIYWLRDELGLSRSAMARGRLVHLMIGLYLFVHVFACLLYQVGKSDGGWISEYKDRLQDEGLSNSAGHNYLVCLHWTLSQLQGNVDLYPGTTTTLNLFFVVISSACSIVALTLFVSGATDTFSDIRQQTQRLIDEERLLREFFARHDIDTEVKHRANHYLHQKKMQQKILECKVRDDEALKRFPKQLQSILRAEMWSSFIVRHPLIAYLSKQHRNLFVKVCADVLSLLTYEPNDDVFVVDDASNCAYVIVRGDFMVTSAVDLTVTAFAGVVTSSAMLPASRSRISTKSDDSKKKQSLINHPKKLDTTKSFASSAPASPNRGNRQWANENSNESYDRKVKDAIQDKSKPMRKVVSGQIVSEISLWMSWVHVGDLSSRAHGHCLQLSTDKLIATLKPFDTPYGIFASYAQRFVEAAKYMQQTRMQSFTELMGFQEVLEAEKEIESLTSSLSE